jgi:Tfp pilus assembly protein PilX
MRYLIRQRNTERGFTLLLAAIISVVILTIGLTILNSSLKQFVLSEVALESERAFHAAYAGVECAQFWNVDDVWDVGAPNRNIRCVEQAVATTDAVVTNTHNADEIKNVQFTWTNADSYSAASPTAYTYEMCTDITVYKYYDAGATTNMTMLPAGFNQVCAIGVECTVVVARGYNQPCANINNIRTVEREITVRF